MFGMFLTILFHSLIILGAGTFFFTNAIKTDLSWQYKAARWCYAVGLIMLIVSVIGSVVTGLLLFG